MTLLIIAITCVVSIYAFKNQQIITKYRFNAYIINHKKEWYRLFSHGLLHADWNHLLFNMLTLFFFGNLVEEALDSTLLYLLLYISGIAVASLSSLKKHKDNIYYNSLGASGGVSAVLFASIFFEPMNGIYLFFIPIPIPGFVFGIAYLAYSQYMSKRNTDNVNHDAHFLGAIYGFLFPLLCGFSFQTFLTAF